MFISKIPVLSKNKNQQSGSKAKSSVKMEMNAEVMYLQAKIKVMEQENADLKEERDNALCQLDVAEKYKVEILVMKETQKVETVQHQIEISNMRKNRNKALNFSRRAEIAMERKLAESEKAMKEKIKKIEKDAAEKLKEAHKEAAAALEAKHKEMRIWKDKFDQLDKIVEDFNATVDKRWPELSDDKTTTLISHLLSKRDQVQVAKMQSAGNQEKVYIEFCPNFSMVSILGLNNNGVTQHQREQIRRIPLEGEPWAYNGKQRQQN